MAGQKISLLNSVTDLQSKDMFIIARGGLTYKLEGSVLASSASLNALSLKTNTLAAKTETAALSTFSKKLSSIIDDNKALNAILFATNAQLNTLQTEFNSSFITNISASQTYIPLPIGNQSPQPGNVLTWHENNWVPGTGVAAISGNRTLDIAPVGSIVYFAGQTNPNGYMPCDGRSLNKILYLDLFEAIGYQYGGSAPGNSFSIPNLGNINSLRPYIKFDQLTGTSTLVNEISGFIQNPVNILFPTQIANNDKKILTYNKDLSAWVAANPPTELPQTATSGQLLTYNGSQWIAGPGFTHSITTGPSQVLSDTTNINIENIPSTAKRITIIFSRTRLTPNQGNSFRIRLGTSATGLIAADYYTTSTAGYVQTVNSGLSISNFNTANASDARDAFYILGVINTINRTGSTAIVSNKNDADLTISFMKAGTNTWVMSHVGRIAEYSVSGGGSVIVSGVVDRMNISTTNPNASKMISGNVTVYWE